MCKYTCACIQIYLNIYIHICVYIHIHTYIFVNICVLIFIYICIHICIHTLMYTDPYKYIYIHIHIYTYIYRHAQTDLDEQRMLGYIFLLLLTLQGESSCAIEVSWCIFQENKRIFRRIREFSGKYVESSEGWGDLQANKARTHLKCTAGWNCAWGRRHMWRNYVTHIYVPYHTCQVLNELCQRLKFAKAPEQGSCGTNESCRIIHINTSCHTY